MIDEDAKKGIWASASGLYDLVSELYCHVNLLSVISRATKYIGFAKSIFHSPNSASDDPTPSSGTVDNGDKDRYNLKFGYVYIPQGEAADA